MPQNSDLTTRQKQILGLIASGKTGREIALALGVSVRSISHHRERIMQKLDLHKTADLTRAAIRMGVIEP